MMPAMTMCSSSFASFLMPVKKPTTLFHFRTKPSASSMGRHSSPRTTTAKITSINTALAAKKMSRVSPPEPLEAMGALLVCLCCSSEASLSFAKAKCHHQHLQQGAAWCSCTVLNPAAFSHLLCINVNSRGGHRTS